MLGEIDTAHPAFADLPNDAVATHDRAEHLPLPAAIILDGILNAENNLELISVDELPVVARTIGTCPLVSEGTFLRPRGCVIVEKCGTRQSRLGILAAVGGGTTMTIGGCSQLPRCIDVDGT